MSADLYIQHGDLLFRFDFDRERSTRPEPAQETGLDLKDGSDPVWWTAWGPPSRPRWKRYNIRGLAHFWAPVPEDSRCTHEVSGFKLFRNGGVESVRCRYCGAARDAG